MVTVVILPEKINTVWSGDKHYVKNMVWNAARVDSIHRLHHHTRWLLFTCVQEYLFIKPGNASLRNRPVAEHIGLETASDSPALITIPRAVFARADSGSGLVRGKKKTKKKNNGTVVVASSVMRCQTKDKKAHIWRSDRMTAFWRDWAQTSTTTQMDISRRPRNEVHVWMITQEWQIVATVSVFWYVGSCLFGGDIHVCSPTVQPHFTLGKQMTFKFVNSLLSGSFLSKFSSLSAPTKMLSVLLSLSVLKEKRIWYLQVPFSILQKIWNEAGTQNVGSGRVCAYVRKGRFYVQLCTENQCKTAILVAF